MKTSGLSPREAAELIVSLTQNASGSVFKAARLLADTYLSEHPSDVAYGPLHELRAALKADEDYAWTWLCNLACIGMDSGGSHESSNRRAAAFLRAAFDVDVRTQEHWKHFETKWATEDKSPPSIKAIEIAARVWCDQEMGNVVMDHEAALAIAKIIDRARVAVPV